MTRSLHHSFVTAHVSREGEVNITAEEVTFLKINLNVHENISHHLYYP